MLDGINVGEAEESELSEIRNQKIGFVFQTYNLISKTNALKNIELPKDKALFIGLTAIYGIGQSTAKKICKAVNIDPEMKVRDVTNEQENILRGEVDKYLVEGELRREVQMNIKNKMEIGSYQGIRHKKGLPVHGQSTRSNAKTRKGKGKVVANKKKATK